MVLLPWLSSVQGKNRTGGGKKEDKFSWDIKCTRVLGTREIQVQIQIQNRGIYVHVYIHTTKSYDNEYFMFCWVLPSLILME